MADDLWADSDTRSSVEGSEIKFEIVVEGCQTLVVFYSDRWKGNVLGLNSQTLSCYSSNLTKLDNIRQDVDALLGLVYVHSKVDCLGSGLETVLFGDLANSKLYLFWSNRNAVSNFLLVSSRSNSLR